MPLQYKIDVLEALKANGKNTTTLRKENLLSEGAIQSLRQRDPISWKNIGKLCKLLACQPGDLLEYVDGDDA